MKIGIIALGSHQERHGAALPPDTDARIAEHLGRKVAERTDAEFLGTLEKSYELPEIKTGKHYSLNQLVEELKGKIKNAKSDGFEVIVVVNAHGGNQKLEGRLGEIEEETQINLDMDSTICKLEGPHAGTGELSVGARIGITDESRLKEHGNTEKYPEVGFAGMKEVRDKYDWAEEHAQEIINEGVEIDELLGFTLLERSIASAADKVDELKAEST